MEPYVRDYHAPIYDATLYSQPNGEFTARGDQYDQMHLLYPWLKPFYTKFEKEYSVDYFINFMKDDHYVIPLLAVGAYVLFIFVLGPWYMKDKEGYTLNKPLAIWNLSLSLFSFYGVSRTVPYLLYRIFTETFEDTVCRPAHLYASGSVGLATGLFILSKIPELIDTVFLVLKKKPVIFLHWYHHITVLLYCWNSYVTESGAGLYFVSMNYCVHAMMYFYFFLMALRSIPQWYNPFPLTVFQITQMVVGTTVVSSCIYYHNYGSKEYKYYLGTQKCHNLISNLYAGGIMYASYLYLFCEFAVKRFFFGINDYAKKPNFRDTSTSATTKENKKNK